MICNPFQAFTSFGGMAQSANPFEAWQKLWLQGLQQGAQAIQATQQPTAVASLPQPSELFGQFTAMQNLWLNAFAPPASHATAAMSAPKITITTIELGDLRPYMALASQMFSAWQPYLQNNSRGFGGQR